MKAAGIICEYNPFHNGHKYLIDNVRRSLNPDAVVCVMSGDFVQRGEPALWNKYTRAEMAVLGGADIVLELPVCFALNSAKEFARGAVSILKSLGVVRYLAFGSECGDIDALNKIAEYTYLENRQFTASLKLNLGKGMSYPAAYTFALQDIFTDYNPNTAAAPNNILAIEYLKQNLLQDAGLKPYTVERFGVNHDDYSLNEGFASGKYLRKLIKEDGCNKENYVKLIPTYVSDKIFDGLITKGYEKTLFELLRYKVLNSSENDLLIAPEISEGLENKIKKEVINADSFDGFVQSIKSKRYTYSRISRILMQILLGIDKESLQNAGTIKNLRVLAFNNIGRDVINEVKHSGMINLWTNIDKQYFDANPDYYIESSMRASDIYSIISSKKIYSQNDMVCNSIYCNI